MEIKITPAMAAALSKFQAACPEINLDGKVKFGNTEFRYATLGNILKLTKSPLKDAGLVITQPIFGDKIITLLTCIEDGSLLQAEMTLPNRNKLQDTGADITYCRRYMYVSLLGIVGEDDKDLENMEPINPSKKKITRELIDKAKMRILSGEAGVIEKLNEFFELTTEQVMQLQSVHVDS